MKHKKIETKSFSSANECRQRENIVRLFKECPIPDNELLLNLGLFIKRQDLTRILFMNEIYMKILDVHGIIIEFGTRWGQNLALFESFRGIYEPYNHNRKIVGFDTFSGFPAVQKQDGKSEVAKKGAYAVTDCYEEYLNQILDYHEQESPISHIKKHQIIKGDASNEFKKYLKVHPETIIAFAYFDFDIYQPTKECLVALKNHITKGSVIGFDELNVHSFPGETLAMKEVLGLNRFKIQRSKYSSVNSFVVIE